MTNNKTDTITHNTIELSDIEGALTQHGYFCLLDWLLSYNHIPYCTYEQWRYGKINYLDTQLNINTKELTSIANRVQSLSQKLHLVQQVQDYYSWSQPQKKRLNTSQNAERHHELTVQWIRPRDMPQMDLFMDNAALVAENSLADALCARAFDAAQTQLNKLIELNSKHDKLGRYQDLINYGYHMRTEQIQAENFSAELEALEQEVVPLAKEVLKHQARDYLAFAWRRLDQNLKGQPFDPAREKIHRSYALMQIPDWEAAANSMAEEKYQYQHPILLQRAAQCFDALKNDNKALLCWCLFMELDRDKCEAAIEAKVSSRIYILWQDFWEDAEKSWSWGDDNDGEPREFFPAYVFAKRPGLVHHLQDLPHFQSAATNAVIHGILARLSQQDEIPSRKKMQDISPALLRLFLNS